ncbi:caspase domain-containing protein [Armillaria nabsnona]|nr:caspase domain-containing protein [Armillaria nabsnona]
MPRLTEDINEAFNAHVLYLFTQYRTFAILDAEAEAARCQALKAKIDKLSDKISLLQDYETRLATQYGMTGVVDSVEVFQEAKARALLRKETPCIDALIAVDALYHLRLESATIQRRFSAYRVQAPLHYTLSQRPNKRMDASRFWAVIIGIDAYPNSELHGCISDALSMEDYLRYVGVPEGRLQLILGPNEHISRKYVIPSRENIIGALLSLITNPNIINGDNIVIYFSGHGSNYSWFDYYVEEALNSSGEFNAVFAAGSVEALCPVDRNEPDDKGCPIPDISDREINIILSELSHVKGNHITLILDCCHSGSASRSISQPGVRTLGPLPRGSFKDMLLAADDNLERFPRHQSVFAEDRRPDTESHVVLAACGEYEFAKEMPGDTGINGFFTKSLIGTLTSGHLTEEATYVDLVAALDRSCHQTPVAAGKHKYSKLWYQN